MGLMCLILVGGCGDGDGRNAAETSNGVIDDSRPVVFIDEADRRGANFTANSDMGEGRLMPEIVMGGGGAIDFDDDGWMDLYLLQGGDGANLLLRNQGDGTFAPVSDPGDAADDGYAMGLATADIDGDGDVDIYIGNVGPDVLLRNDGGGRFTDITAEAGLGDPGFAASVSFFDADLDGDHDLFVSRYLDWSRENEITCTATDGDTDYCAPVSYEAPCIDLFYENDGTGRFIDRTVDAGFSEVKGTGLGVAAADFNGNGYPDLFVANDDMPDRLWQNQGDGTFIESGFALGCDRDFTGMTKAGMGVSINDVDNDGDPDLIVCNLNGESDSFYLNQNGRFLDVTNRSGIGSASIAFTRFGLGFIDFDNDGVLDYFAANGAVRRARSPKPGDPYAEVNLMLRGRKTGLGFDAAPDSGLAGLPPRTSRAAIFADFDNDGGMDVVVVNRDAPIEFLTNQAGPTQGHWMLLDVRNAAGAPALGATITIEAGDKTWTRIVRTDSSYLASRDPRVHLGLGDEKMVRRVEVKWPTGETRSWEDLPADQVHRLEPIVADEG